ncbi:uncharacterized protein CANTADRAFT_25168 [Suhomyces tanzawaensis NRRL Y-17324]|uniref:Uncharacterized protein n=1 Tax=Suhomyces tanzawaensis NRRL Y-17324 TaxID=984487 RepID=A0A1E4SMZ0_9ASCO|nr:uncharacterized protein CANTADRAFT_25168 [Suhomyces tanzawaensis NRRL Y-17324]ODV80752.1 hypothetical protein CANTADRAFT_25168 [Suhomyces tanzawaensis NRRL Y-17324]
MTSPRKVALRYLESLGDDSPVRMPLQPTQKFNSPARPKDEDLDALAKQLNITPSGVSPSKTALLRTRFESPSVTVSSFKTPLNKSSLTSSSRTGSPIKKGSHGSNATERRALVENKPDLHTNEGAEDSELPSWAKKNYKDVLTRLPARNTPTAPRNTSLHHDTPTTIAPLKQQMSTPAPAPKARPFLQSPSNSTARDSPGYEYLCRIQAIKQWLEQVLDEPIAQEPVQLIAYIRNGIHLAKLANVILPSKRNVFTNDSKLQFRHTENINRFFGLLDYMNVPDLFRFELTDLYDAKNVPKVWFCLHAMSYMLNKSDQGYPRIQNLVDQVDFDDDDIRQANRALVGSGLPNFASADTGDASQPDNSYMAKMTESPTRAIPRPVEKASRLVEIQVSVRQPSPPPSFPKKFVSSAIQTDEINPFRVDLNAASTSNSVGTSTFSSRLHEYQAAPLYTFDEEPVQLRQKAPKPIVNLAEIDTNTANIIKLQSLARGANFRYKMFVDKIMLKSFSDELSYLLCIIRGNLSRSRTIHRHRDELLYYKTEVVELQAMIRSKLARNRRNVDFGDSHNDIQNLQSIARGHVLRYKVKRDQMALWRQTDAITDLQSVVRRNRVYQYSRVVLPHLSSIEELVVSLQSLCRGYLAKNSTRYIGTSLSKDAALIQFQAVLRGAIVRGSIEKKRKAVGIHLPGLLELQSIARGGISRSQLCNDVLLTLLYEDQVLNELYAKIRANKLRKQVQRTKFALEFYEQKAIVPVQTLFRGVLTRFKKEIMLDDMYQEVDSLILFQSIIRGNRIRYNYREMIIYYHYNIEKVIKAQSIFRSKITQHAYHSLVNLKNPSLGTISKFAYLLTDNDIDYREEIELSDLKDRIIESSKTNEDLENQIESLDIKLGLLDKNKITIEEFMKNKKKPALGGPSTSLDMGAKTMDKLNKNSRQRIELYQSMFYLLQTKPAYFIRLFKALGGPTNADEESSKTLKDLQSIILLIFPITDLSVNEHSREEYFFIKFILDLMKYDIENNCPLITEITKAQSCHWIEYFLNFNNHTYQRQHLKSLTGGVIDHIIENEELSFESDPCEIYAEIANKEIKVDGYTSKNMEGITPQVAIKTPEVSSQFIENLMNLREISTDFLNILDQNISKIPLHVRLICNQCYKLSKIQFPSKPNQQHLAVAGVVFIKHYISNILQYPENFGYLVRDPFNPSIINSFKCGKNLKSLARVLLQLFSLKPFSDNFLKPLNDYLTSSSDITKLIISRLIDVDGLEQEYQMNDYNDIINHARPSLTMNVSKMIEVEKFISERIDIMAPSSDDQLFANITTLNNTLNTLDDYMTLTEFGSITLNLNPTTKEDSLADSKYRSMLTQVKRCVIYIIRIQQGENLLELLISGIQDQHEQKFKEIVSTEKKEIQQSKSNEKKNPYYRTSLGDLSLITYHELKKMALNLIIKLETEGHVTRKNCYQDILNNIAIDIKTKDSQRSSRKSQLEITLKAIEKLSDKQKFLRKQLSDYNNHIEKILSQLQSKPKDRKIFNIIPVFSKQYFYHRELRKRNRLPKFGSYKYSAKKLMDQGILLDFGGVNFGSSKLDLMFSCNEVGKFIVEVATGGSVSLPGAFNVITLDELLNIQYEGTEKIEMFDDLHMVFRSETLISFIFRKFYDIH